MKINYKYILSAVILSFSATAMAQELNSAYFTNDFKNRHDLNPAFGNEQNYFSMPGMGNINVGLKGNFGIGDVLFDNPLYPSGSSKKKTTFMNPNISAADALSGFNSENKINGGYRIALFSFGFKSFGGYSTFELNVRGDVGVNLPYELFEFAKNTGNKTYNIGDINVESKHFAEIALGHSRQINDKLRVGAKAKVLLGLARGSFDFKNVKADLADGNQWTISGDAQASVSVKSVTYKSELKDYKGKTGSYEHVTGIDVDKAGLDGMGLAVDLGAEYKITDDIKVSAALLDLGFISWKNDVQATNNAKSFTFNGFHDTSVTSDGNNTIDNQTDDYSDQISDFANLQDKGDKGSKKTGIGATMNVGCEYVLPMYRPLSVGLLCSSRFNGDYSWTEGRLSANIAPLKWINGGVNLAVGTYGTSFGWIVNIHPSAVNLFVGMDHVVAKCSKEFIPLHSNASVSMGLSFAW